MIWLVFALLTGVAVLSILWPLSRPAPNAREDAADVAFYRDQIAEIDAEFARGGLDGEQAQAAKALAARRLLAAAPEEVATPASAPGRADRGGPGAGRDSGAGARALHRRSAIPTCRTCRWRRG